MNSSAARAHKFEQELGGMVAKVTVEQLSPPPFMSELQQVFVAVSRETVTRALESQDPPGGAIMVDGQQLRYRGSRKRK